MNCRRFTFLIFFVFSMVGMVACGNSGGPTRPDPTPSAALDVTTTSSTAAAHSSSTSPVPTLTSQEKEAIDIMWDMVGRYGSTNDNAVAAAGRNGHPGLVPVLIETVSRTFEPDVALEIAKALEEITGERVGGEFVLAGPWYSWMSKQEPPQVELEGFDEWRGQLLAAIDPNFRRFFNQDVPTRIPIWSVQWGGVHLDGIPPLELPKTVPGKDVQFLQPDEPVFGVTVNGESRAYPHRIMGWHELANDVLGGELITFVF